MNNLEYYKNKFTEMNVIKKTSEADLKKVTDEVNKIKDDLDTHLKARVVLTTVLELTQNEFKQHVESLVTMMISTIFDKDYKFVLEFEERNNQLECKPVIYEGKDIYSANDKDDDLGGSVLDIISFSLRIVLWGLEESKSRNIFVLDEPMKWLGNGDELDRAGKLLRELSHELGIQLLIVTHEPQFIEMADRAFLADKYNKRTTIKEIER